MCKAHSPGGLSSEKLSDQGSGPPGSVDFDWRVVGLAVELLGDRGGDLAGPVVLVAHAPSGPVLLEAVADVEVLLEVVEEREVEEGPAVGGEFHGRCKPALNSRSPYPSAGRSDRPLPRPSNVTTRQCRDR